MNEQLDIAIRAAEPDPNSLLIARYLTQWRLCICANPTYRFEEEHDSVRFATASELLKFRDSEPDNEKHVVIFY